MTWRERSCWISRSNAHLSELTSVEGGHPPRLVKLLEESEEMSVLSQLRGHWFAPQGKWNFFHQLTIIRSNWKMTTKSVEMYVLLLSFETHSLVKLFEKQNLLNYLFWGYWYSRWPKPKEKNEGSKTCPSTKQKAKFHLVSVHRQ